jgi:tripartite-type tricarboxylate transporter receptor subunit TctC
MVIPFPPGGSNDIIGRMMGMHLSERLGKSVVVDNRAGAGGNMGIDIAAKSDPDGYTMLIISAAYAFAPSMYQKLPYDQIKSFVPVAKIGNGPNVVSVNPGLGVKTAKELIAMAKAKPGQLHLASELFKSMAQIDIVHIPFKGGFPAMVDVMSGNSHMVIGTVVQALPHIKSGKLRAVGVATKRRNPALPDVPTIDESG